MVQPCWYLCTTHPFGMCAAVDPVDHGHWVSPDVVNKLEGRIFSPRDSFSPSQGHRWILGLSLPFRVRRTFEGRDPGSPFAPRARPSRVVQTFERRRVRGTADVPTVAGRGWTHRMVLQHQPIRSSHTCVDPLRPSASKRRPRKESHVRSHPIESAW